jgi:hypothetical protein
MTLRALAAVFVLLNAAASSALAGDVAGVWFAGRRRIKGPFCALRRIALRDDRLAQRYQGRGQGWTARLLRYGRLRRRRVGGQGLRTFERQRIYRQDDAPGQQPDHGGLRLRRPDLQIDRLDPRAIARVQARPASPESIARVTPILASARSYFAEKSSSKIKLESAGQCNQPLARISFSSCPEDQPA